MVFAGLTVVIALVGLMVGHPDDDRHRPGRRPVAVAVIIALTLLPAMLGFAGNRISQGQPRRRKTLERGEGRPMGVRWARFVTRNRR